MDWRLLDWGLIAIVLVMVLERFFKYSTDKQACINDCVNAKLNFLIERDGIDPAEIEIPASLREAVKKDLSKGDDHKVQKKLESYFGVTPETATKILLFQLKNVSLDQS